MWWHKHIIIVQKLTMMVELWSLLSPCCLPSIERTIQLSSALNSQERPMKILSTSYVVHWCLHAKNHPCGKVVSAVVMFCLPFGHHTSLELHIDRHGHHVTCVLIGTSRNLAAYKYTAHWQTLNKAWVRAGGYKRSLPRYPLWALQ